MREKTKIAQLTEDDQKLIRAINFLTTVQRYAPTEEIARLVLRVSPFDPLTADQQHEISSKLAALVARRLVNASRWGYQVTDRGYWSDNAYHIREYGISKIQAANFGWRPLRPSDGLFDTLNLTDQLWSELFQIVDDNDNPLTAEIV